jgi:hypothetical protein
MRRKHSLQLLLCSHQKLVTGDLVVRDTICLNSSVLTTYHVTQTIALAQEMVASKGLETTVTVGRLKKFPPCMRCSS